LEQFEWVDFYKEFARTLLPYKNNRKVIIDKIISVYQTAEINLPTLEKDNNIVDIDPFTVFGLFNKSSLKDTNRVKIISGLAKEFSVSIAAPTAFGSIPTLNNQNATFYYFVGDRDEDDIDNLWKLFEAALKYADNPSSENRTEISKYFDIVINKKGNGNSKVTMGLYWISPDVFLNLDSRNEWFIYSSGKIPADVVASLPEIEAKISAKKYFDIIEALTRYIKNENSSFKDFKELSLEAWRYSTEVNEENRKIAKTTREEKPNALADGDVQTVHYWLYAPGDNAYKWDEFRDAGIMAIGWSGIGDLGLFDTKDAMKKKMKELFGDQYTYKNAAHATWQFANEIKPGDVVFVKKGMHKIIGRGIVTGEYQYSPDLASDDHDFGHTHTVNWTHNGEWEHPGQAVVKTLTDITQYTEYVAKLNALFEDDTVEEVEETEIQYPTYSADDFLSEVYMSQPSYETLTNLLKNKKNIIMQGAPGVGKTFAAKRLAYSMMGVKDSSRVMMVQFHQSYSYEDFIMGFRPASTGFELKKGPFYTFCKKAEMDIENDYFFIIDEINRGNLSKIFGELFMLIESDKRGVSLQLLYSDEKFSVPSNVHIIGMMNTADRSLAMLDYALRRRFAFFEFSPAFETEGFRHYRQEKNNKKFDNLIATIEKLNTTIENDETLGRGFRIGHSYFCTENDIDDMWLNSVVTYEIVPLLNEYWFDEPSKVRDWEYALREAIR